MNNFYVSTRDKQVHLTSKEAILKGISDDGGLFVWPDLADVKIDLNQRFYILCLAPNAARLSIRFFYENSFGNILKNLSDHYERMAIVKPEWEKEYLSIQEMLMETGNNKLKGIY